MPKKLNTKKATEFCETLINELLPKLITTEEYVGDYTGVCETLEEERGNDKWRVSVNWFPAYTDPRPIKEPLLEIHVTRIRNNKNITQAFLYKVGTGNDAYPQWKDSGWVVELF